MCGTNNYACVHWLCSGSRLGQSVFHNFINILSYVLKPGCGFHQGEMVKVNENEIVF